MFYIGIHLEKASLRVAVLKKEKRGISIESLESFPYGPDNVKLFYNLSPFHTGKETRVTSGIGCSETFIRKLHIPLKDRRKILEALPFQLESLVPFSDESTLICPLFKPLSKQMTAVTVIATSEESLNAHLGDLKNLDIRSDTISCEASALMRFNRWKFPSIGKVLCLHAHHQKLSCVVCEGEEILLSQSLSFEENADLSKELEKLSIFLKQKGGIDDKTPWFLTGNLHFAEQIKNVFSGEALLLDDITNATFAIPIGLALDDLKEDAFSVQFCQKKFTPSHTLHSRQKKAFSYLAFCLGAAVLMAIGSSTILGKNQRLLVQSLKDYITPSLASGSFTSMEDIEENLYAWEDSLKQQKSSFALLPTVPKVSDVLAWLSSHPCFATEEGNSKEGVEIKSLHYTLTKHPKIGETSAPYLAHVELEFTSQTPRAARDFHEILLKGDEIVNAKKDIKWQTQNHTYHTAFELNPRSLQ